MVLNNWLNLLDTLQRQKKVLKMSYKHMNSKKQFTMKGNNGIKKDPLTCVECEYNLKWKLHDTWINKGEMFNKFSPKSNI